jgi:hypothetical protein
VLAPWRAFNWAANTGLAAFALADFDFLENWIMGTSLDTAMAGEAVDAGRIAYQVAISSAKWNAAMLMLVAFTFIIPGDRLLENSSSGPCALSFQPPPPFS